MLKDGPKDALTRVVLGDGGKKMTTQCHTAVPTLGKRPAAGGVLLAGR